MDKLVRKIEVPLAKNAVKKAGLYLVPEERLGELADVAMDAYQDYPLHNWFSGGTYDPKASRIIMDISPISCLKELIYCELFFTWCTDYTPLYGCTALEDLNVSKTYAHVDLKQFGEMPWLKNLWLSENSATKEERAYLAEKLPNTHIYYDGYTPTSGGWRELQNYYDMRDLLEMPYNPW